MKLYFSIKNSKELGLWKNSPNMQIEKTIIDEYFNQELSLKVCESIARFENYLENIENKKEKDDFKSADLAFKYIICKYDLKDEEVADIINNINKHYFYNNIENKSKLIDIYKSANIINKIENELKKYIDNKNKVNN